MAAEITVEVDLCRGCGDVALREGGGSQVIHVVESYVRGGGNDSGRRARGRCPARMAGGAKVRKRAGPRIRGVHVHDGIPMQSIYGKTWIVYGSIGSIQASTLQMSVGSHGEGLQIHFQAAVNSATKVANAEFRQEQGIVR